MRTTDFAEPVLGWYRLHGRKRLPWQLDKTPYRVWVSEIMLQQTQVATVIPYYQRFLKRFPNLSSLADASSDEVLQLWQGLGYYARARNMQHAAQIIRDECQGIFPRELERVMALPGIGRSTAGAILTFACKQSWPILDGNVKRVLARCFEVSGWYGQVNTMKQLWALAERLTPQQHTDQYNQAMMDIGAMLCLKTNPNCEACPLSDRCESYRHNTQARYPEKKPKKARPNKQTLMLLHRYRNRILLWRRPPTGIWGGLWSLPEVGNAADITDWQRQHLSLTRSHNSIDKNLLKHQFTHFSLDISLAVIELDRLPGKVSDNENMVFVKADGLSEYGLPTPVRRILENVLKLT
ncbi:MAG: A/G-specific adenine glycosylase [Proteobacteria bacterium]|nr:A/G-specific adenine glycosylase [Pseudomonadota bacterium]